MTVERVHQSIRNCKDQCNTLVAILYKNRGYDTVGVLSTAAECNKILLQCLQNCKENEDGSIQIPDFIWKLEMIFKELCDVNIFKFYRCKVFSLNLINNLTISLVFKKAFQTV